MKRKIAAVTTSRADFTALYWPLHDLASHPEVDLRIIALGPHLSPEFGSTIREIEKAGLPVDARIECLLSSDTDIGMAKTIGDRGPLRDAGPRFGCIGAADSVGAH